MSKGDTCTWGGLGTFTTQTWERTVTMVSPLYSTEKLSLSTARSCSIHHPHTIFLSGTSTSSSPFPTLNTLSSNRLFYTGAALGGKGAAFSRTVGIFHFATTRLPLPPLPLLPHGTLVQLHIPNTLPLDRRRHTLSHTHALTPRCGL